MHYLLCILNSYKVYQQYIRKVYQHINQTQHYQVHESSVQDYIDKVFIGLQLY